MVERALSHCHWVQVCCNPWGLDWGEGWGGGLIKGGGPDPYRFSIVTNENILLLENNKTEDLLL